MWSPPFLLNQSELNFGSVWPKTPLLWSHWSSRSRHHSLILESFSLLTRERKKSTYLIWMRAAGVKFKLKSQCCQIFHTLLEWLSAVLLCSHSLSQMTLLCKETGLKLALSMCVIFLTAHTARRLRICQMSTVSQSFEGLKTTICLVLNIRQPNTSLQRPDYCLCWNVLSRWPHTARRLGILQAPQCHGWSTLFFNWKPQPTVFF